MVDSRGKVLKLGSDGTIGSGKDQQCRRADVFSKRWTSNLLTEVYVTIGSRAMVWSFAVAL